MTNSLKRFFCVSLLLIFCFSAHSQEFSRKKYNFNSDWKFKVEDLTGAEAIDYKTSDWTSVTLPYAFNENEAFKKTSLSFQLELFGIEKNSNCRKA